MSKIYLISDTHFNRAKIATYCDRPADFTQQLIRNWCQIVKREDCVIHLGDVFIGPVGGWREIGPLLSGRKILVRGNHDRKRSLTWWMNNGFDAAVDAMVFRNCWVTHEPDPQEPPGGELNIHGHLHNVWHGFRPNGGEPFGETRKPWQRLFAVEYTNYMPVEFDKFVNHPERFQSCGPANT